MLIGIVAMTPEGLIGNEDGLPWHIPSDLAFFKKITTGKTLIVGSKTFETLPPLPDRDIIVMSRDVKLDIDDVRVVNSLEELGEEILDEKINIVAGGAEIYKLLMPFCDFFYVTEVFDRMARGETYFPVDDLHELFKLNRYDLQIDEKTDTPLIFKLYEKKERI